MIKLRTKSEILDKIKKEEEFIRVEMEKGLSLSKSTGEDSHMEYSARLSNEASNVIDALRWVLGEIEDV